MSTFVDNGIERVKVATVKEHMICPVCVSTLKDPHITYCGHRFCKECILEWLNGSKVCPCCNGPLSRDQVFRDPLFENLIGAVKAEESDAEKKYFNELIDSATGNAVRTCDNYQNLRKFFSPVEEVLKEHLKRSFSSYEKFYQNLQADLGRHQMEVDLQLKRDMQKLQEAKGNAVTDADIQKLITDADTQKNELSANVQQCCTLVAEAYDRYLNEHIPHLSVLPVTVTVSLLQKGLQFNGVQLKPQDSIADLRMMISELVTKKLGENVVSFEDDVQFLYFKPLARRSLFENLRICSDIIEHKASNPDITVLSNNCRPVLECGVKPGSEIAVYGTIRCESDLPKTCFAATFQADENKPMDYFQCKSCNLKYIRVFGQSFDKGYADLALMYATEGVPSGDSYAKGREVTAAAAALMEEAVSCLDSVPPSGASCNEHPSFDHDVSLYVAKHLASWACCYCMRKNKCVIQKQNLL